MRPLTKVSSGASEPPPRDPATGCAACAEPAGSAAATPAAAPALSKLRRDRRLRSLFSSLILGRPPEKIFCLHATPERAQSSIENHSELMPDSHESPLCART